MTSWMQGTRLDPATFSARFFGREAGDPVANALHSAAILAATATSHADLRAAAAKVADAIQAVGLDQWSRFVAEASERARDPVTLAAVEKSRQPADPHRDAIRPVYPIETAIGAVAAGVTGGVAAAARSVGGAILRQVPTGAGRRPGSIPPSKAESTPPNLGKQAETDGPFLPAQPDDLLTRGWKETTHAEAAKMGHRTFENPTTGESIRFDRGRAGEAGFEGRDHYHRLNPSGTNKRDEYLDVHGNPVARGSNPSHIIPREP